MGHEGHDHDHDHDPPHAPADRGRSHPPAREQDQVAAVPEAHKAHAPAQVAAFIVTCSDSRDAGRDDSGALLRRALEANGHLVVGTRLIPDDAAQIRSALEAALQVGARAVIFSGGTGVSSRDVTVETLEPLFERRLPGFGELFRMLSFEQIGSASWLSRATAGVHRGAVIFALPGSPKAAQLAIERLILPELGHVVRELSR